MEDNNRNREIIVSQLALIASWNFGNKIVTREKFDEYFNSVALDDFDEKQIMEEVFQEYLQLVSNIAKYDDKV